MVEQRTGAKQQRRDRGDLAQAVGKHHKHKKRHYHNSADGEKKDWKDWEYYDDWWEEDGKTSFHAYAENMKKEPETKTEEKKEESSK